MNIVASTMRSTPWAPALIALASCTADGADETPCPVPSEIEARLEAMLGPLGCAPTQFMLADPPDGCAGAERLVSDVRAEYVALSQEAGCGTRPASLTPIVSRYRAAFRAQHPFVQHDIARAGASISAREFGAEHAGNGATIVLMHGFPDNQHLYDRIAPALGESHHTVTFDFLGWGESPGPAAGHTYAFAELRADLDAVLAHFGATQIVPVVHDASGWPGIDWALDNPDSVAALVLLNTVYHPIAGQAPPNVIRAASAPDLRATFVSAVGTDELTSRALLRAQVSRFFEDRAAEQTFLPLFEHYAASTRAGILGLTAKLGETLMARAANVGRMQTFSKPVTIAFGEADPYLNPTVARAFASAFPSARLELVPEGGHYVQLDRPNEIVQAIRAAVDGI